MCHVSANQAVHPRDRGTTGAIQPTLICDHCCAVPPVQESVDLDAGMFVGVIAAAHNPALTVMPDPLLPPRTQVGCPRFLPHLDEPRGGCRRLLPRDLSQDA